MTGQYNQERLQADVDEIRAKTAFSLRMSMGESTRPQNFEIWAEFTDAKLRPIGNVRVTQSIGASISGERKTVARYARDGNHTVHAMGRLLVAQWVQYQIREEGRIVAIEGPLHSIPARDPKDFI